MKKLHNRIFSLLTALAMVFTLFSGVTLTAQAKENAPVYRNVMYYGDWSSGVGRETSIRRIFRQTRLHI